MSIQEYIKKAKDICYDYQYALVCMDEKLMEKYAKQKQDLDLEVMEKFNEDLVCEYFMALD